MQFKYYKIDLLIVKDISKYYEMKDLTQEKLDSEKCRLSTQIKELETKIIELESSKGEGLGALYSKRREVFYQLESILEYEDKCFSSLIRKIIESNKLKRITFKGPTDWEIKEL